MKKLLTLLSVACLVGTQLPLVHATESASMSMNQSASDESEQMTITDDAGRQVTLPKHIKKVLSAGEPAQRVLYSLVPERLVGWSNKPKGDQLNYLPKEAGELPEVGAVYTFDKKINVEEVVKLAPDVIIDTGQHKKTIVEEMDKLQEATGIPVLFFDGMLDDMPSLYEKLGQLFEVDTTEQVAWLKDCLALAQKHHPEVEKNQKTYYIADGDDGLTTCPANGFAAYVPDYIGLQNVLDLGDHDDVNYQEVSGEQVAEWHPDAVLFMNESAWSHHQDEPWKSLPSAEKGGLIPVPTAPFGWVSGSINRMIGIKWLGNLLYPELYDIDIVQEVQDFYRLFYHYELNADQARELMAGSTFKN